MGEFRCEGFFGAAIRSGGLQVLAELRHTSFETPSPASLRRFASVG